MQLVWTFRHPSLLSMLCKCKIVRDKSHVPLEILVIPNPKSPNYSSAIVVVEWNE